MTGKTHITIGLMTGLLLTKYGVITNGSDMIVLPFIVSCGVGATLPDIDHHNSMITNKAGVVGRIIQKTTKHRGFYHSIMSLALLYGVTLLLAAKIEENMMYATVVLGIIALMVLLPYIAKFTGASSKLNTNQLSTLTALVTLTAVVSIVISGKPLMLVMTSIFEGLVVGAASHVLADMFNPDGVPLLWPIPTKFRMPIIRITTGTPTEHGLMILLNFVNIYLIYTILKEGITLW